MIYVNQAFRSFQSPFRHPILSSTSSRASSSSVFAKNRLSWSLVGCSKEPWELPHNLCRPLHSTRPRPARQKKRFCSEWFSKNHILNDQKFSIADEDLLQSGSLTVRTKPTPGVCHCVIHAKCLPAPVYRSSEGLQVLLHPPWRKQPEGLRWGRRG